MNLNGLVFVTTAVGLVLSFAAVALLRPVLPAPWRWQWRGLGLHGALWLLVYGLLLALLGRLWFAMAIGLAFLMLLVQVSNAKHHSLREPFVFQDFDYFTDAIRHPRLYIPFLGWWKFGLVAVAVVAALGIGLWLEAPPGGLLGETALILLAACLLLAISRGGEGVTFLPDEDMRRMGFLASLWHYGVAERTPLSLPKFLPELPDIASLPDLLVIQSESFFDPRRLFSGIRSEVLAEFDRTSAQALSHGRLLVPAWGANTVRSEFAFLTGAPEDSLGVHRFNPYRQILKAEVISLAKRLKAAGYRTVCLHPYPASFYARNKVYPYFGFDEFIDIKDFAGAERFGPYVSDAAVAEKLKEIFRRAEGPIFVFAITMENHGPLHLEKPDTKDVESFYTGKAPLQGEDLTVYLRHLSNADRMIGELRTFLQKHPRSARFCWYGDHVPIMSKVYRELGEPDGLSEYFIWSNRSDEAFSETTLPLFALASQLIKTMGDSTDAENCSKF